jgi:hypothetical protein
MRKAPLSPRVLAVLWIVETSLILAAAEAFVVHARLDMKLLGPLLYYQGAQLPVHQVSSDASLHYALRPGAKAFFEPAQTVTVNSLGYRDKERSARKPPGTFRIVCLGGSNTFGAVVNDDETYPAQLEKELNRGRPGKFEVWNAGVDAYTLLQNVADAKKIAEGYSPDLMIFQLSNCGRRPFLAHEPFERFFREDPGLYAENLRYPRGGGPGWHDRLMRLSGLYRAVVIGINRWRQVVDDPYACNPYNNTRNDAALQGFIASVKERVAVVLLLHPGNDLEPLDTFMRQAPGSNLDERLKGPPVIDLKRDLQPDSPPDYSLIHPPARVYAWYGKKIAAHLREKKLLPR